MCSGDKTEKRVVCFPSVRPIAIRFAFIRRVQGYRGQRKSGLEFGAKKFRFSTESIVKRVLAGRFSPLPSEAAPEHARQCFYYMLFAIWPVPQKTHSSLPTGFSTTRREDRQSSNHKLEAASVRDWLDSGQTERKNRVMRIRIISGNCKSRPATLPKTSQQVENAGAREMQPNQSVPQLRKELREPGGACWQLTFL